MSKSTINAMINHYEEMKPVQRWSRSKQAAMDRLRLHLGKVHVAQLSEKYLVSWALNFPGSILTAQTVLVALSSASKYCHRRGLIELENPNAASEAQSTLKAIGALRQSRRDPGRITDAALLEIMRRWRSNIPPQLLLILLDNVIRSGELCRIVWEDIDLDAREFIIRDRKSPISKWGNHQRVAMRGRTFDVLAALPHRSGRICDYQQHYLSEVFTKAARAAGYDYRLHDLRHEGISRLFDLGYSIPHVQALSGHTNWESLQRYTHVSPRNIHELEKRLAVEPSPLDAFMEPSAAAFRSMRSPSQRLN